MSDMNTFLITAAIGIVGVMLGHSIGSNSAIDAEAGADRLAALESRIEAAGGNAEATAALKGAVDGLGARIDALDAGVSAQVAALGAQIEALAAAPAAAAESPAAPAPVVAEDLLLAPGQTGSVGAQRVFLSRVSGDTAHVMLAGIGDASAGMWTGPIDLGNGCTLSFVGTEDGRAVLRPAC